MSDSSNLTLEPVAVNTLTDSNNLFQGPLWAEFKQKSGWSPAAFEIGWNSRRSNLLTLTREAEPGMHVTYVPAGPDLEARDDEQGLILENLSEALAPHLPESTAYVRYDLPWPSPYAEPQSGQMEIAAVRRPETRIRELRMNFGTENRNLRKAWTDIQPTHTLLVDLTLPLERLLAAMRPKTRYNIGLAARRGVHVRPAGPDELPAFYELYTQTARRNRIRLHDFRYFREIFEAASSPEVPGSAELLFAEADGRKLAGMVLARSGRRATYLYGASADRGRRLMPTYALQWYAMRRAAELGCTQYDLYGIPPSDDPAHPMHGLFRFKTGFGGRFVHRRGCWDYPYSTDDYEKICGRELTGAGYHLR
ncbi:lipid II:glycine glycyltransferase FemX [Salinispira pacifica]